MTMNLKEFYKGIPVLVTGGTGFIGSNLVISLVELGARVKCLVRINANAWRLRHVAEKIEWVEGDLNDDLEEFWTRVCRDSKIVFHLGASGVLYRPDLYWKDLVRTNVIGTCALIYGAASAGVKRIIVAGTCVEYGNVFSNDTITENTPLNPTNIYGATKSASSLLSKVCLEVNGLEGLVLRLFYVYGPGELPPKLIPTLISNALNGKVVKMTEGKQVRDFCFVEDAIRAFFHAGCVGLPEKSPMILNVGSGRQASIAEVARIVMKLIPENGGLELGALPYRGGEISRLVPEVTKTQNILNWQAKYTLQEGLKKTVEWFRKHPKAGEDSFDPLRKEDARYRQGRLRRN